MKRIKKKHIIIFLIIIAALCLRLVYLYQYSSSPLFTTPIGPDVEEYDNWAKEILAWGFSSGRLHIHAPFYPALLASLYYVFSFNMFWVRMFQSVLVFGGFILLAWGIKKYISPARQDIFYILLIFAGLYPPLLFYSSELISESLLLPLVCGVLVMLYLAENKLASGQLNKAAGWIAAAGLGAGLMAITHPASLLFTVAETALLLFSAIYAVSKGQKASRFLIPVFFAAAALLIIVPVCVKNSILAKRFILIQRNSGFNFYLGNNPNADGTCYIRPGRPWEKIHNEAEKAAGKQNISKDQYFRSEAFNFIKSNPAAELKLLLKKALYVWNYKELPAGADSSPIIYFTSIVRYGKYLFILLGSLSICGIIIVMRRRTMILRYRHFLLLIAAGWAAQIITVTSGRYRLMMYPALFVFAAVAVDFLLRKSKNNRKVLKWSGAVAAGALLVCLPSPPFKLKEQQAETDSLLGEAYFRQGKYQQAEKYFQACVEYDPTDGRAYNLLGIISEAQYPKQPGRAGKFYRLAIKHAPREPEGYLNLAIQYSNHAGFQQAEKYFSKALEYGAQKPQVLYNYACFKLKQRRIKDAVKYLPA
jgi:Tfp pilus assembly protein PilF